MSIPPDLESAFTFGWRPAYSDLELSSIVSFSGVKPLTIQPVFKAPTIADVARSAGVSVATASRTLSGVVNVSPALRDQVIQAAAQLGYEANPHARALASAGEATIGVVLHDVENPFFAELVRGMDEVAVAAKRTLIFITAHRDLQRELAAIAHFRARRVEALVIASSGIETRDFATAVTNQLMAFEAGGGRAVLIGRNYGHGDAVLPDNVGGGREVAEELLRLGHRRLGVICGPPAVTTTRERLAGVRDALQRAGVELPDEMLVYGDYTRDSGVAAARELLDRNGPAPTALIAFNDLMAIGAMSEAHSRGMRVPEDISITGFDDVPIARDVTPALTTVRVPAAEMGALALRVALEPRHGAVRVEHVPTRLVRRQSTGPVAG
jgi:LacI family transcriptional regulator